MSKTVYPADPIFVIDDEESILFSIDTTLQLAGMSNVFTCGDSRQVMALVAKRKPSVILLDLNMPHVDGESILDQVAVQYPEIPVIIITGRIDTDTAVKCMKQGAYDYIVKPVEEGRLISSVKKSLQFSELREENQALNQQLREGNLKYPEAFSRFVTHSPKMLTLFSYAESIAQTSHPILITGETGTGKELMARSIHTVSSCKGKFIATNVAGLDDNVLSDTLFGHIKGAFTGAETDRSGLVEAASDGSLFLDEIGDLSPSSQVKLLRLLQEKEFLPLGQDSPRKSTARIITSTHVDLWRLQRENLFRKDLLYRLKIHRIIIPPLRERKEDLYPLVEHFSEIAAESSSKKAPRIPSEIVNLLENFHFPGNIRELQSMVYDAVAQSDSQVLPLKTFRDHISQTRKLEENDTNQQEAGGLPLRFTDPLPTIKKATHMLIEEAMMRAGNNQSAAAAILGISQQALSKRLRKMEEKN